MVSDAGRFTNRHVVTDAPGGGRAGAALFNRHRVVLDAMHQQLRDAERRVLAIVDEHEVTVVALDSGEVLSSHLIDPDRSYWRNQRRAPGRWPESPASG